jgi:hypothetical protein
VPTSVSIIVSSVGCCDEGASIGSVHSLAFASVIVTRGSDSDRARANAVSVRVRFIVTLSRYGLPVRLPVGIGIFSLFFAYPLTTTSEHCLSLIGETPSVIATRLLLIGARVCAFL